VVTYLVSAPLAVCDDELRVLVVVSMLSLKLGPFSLLMTQISASVSDPVARSHSFAKRSSGTPTRTPSAKSHLNGWATSPVDARSAATPFASSVRPGGTRLYGCRPLFIVYFSRRYADVLCMPAPLHAEPSAGRPQRTSRVAQMKAACYTILLALQCSPDAEG
jgi:hypothetical protein